MNRAKIGVRLTQAREKAGLARAEVAKAVNIGTTTLQQWEVGNREASIETLERLAKLYHVSPQYLIFGTDSDSVPTPIADSSADDEYEDVLVYDVLASAGVGSAVFEENVSCRLKFPSWWFTERRLSPAKVVGLYTKGDSMEPTIPDNSLLLLDRSQTHISDGKIYVVRADDELYVKRIKRIIGGGIELISDNPDYETRELDKARLSNQGFFEIMGQVVHIGIDLPHWPIKKATLLQVALCYNAIKYRLNII